VYWLPHVKYILRGFTVCRLQYCFSRHILRAIICATCSPVCEDVVVTRSKSEERLFLEEDSEYSWQPDHLSQSANTSRKTSTPTPPSQSPSLLHQYSHTANPTTPSPEHTHHNPRQPTPPQAPPDSSSGISKSVASYRLRRFKKLSSSEPV